MHFKLISSHQYNIKYTNNFFQNLTKPLELYPKAGSFFFQQKFRNIYNTDVTKNFTTGRSFTTEEFACFFDHFNWNDVAIHESFFYLSPLYSRSEVWEGIWNPTHLVVLNFCLERLHYVTIFHNMLKPFVSMAWAVYTYLTVNFCNRDNGIRNLSESKWVQEFKFSHPMQIFHMISQLY